ncbi:MAG: F0F1 ATP synthase subunit A [Eubacteriales bacterium]|nr:F0F1 ATP synthase subunit A [Bacillota bacterium]MBV1726760.1 F0F1 ATP synthase subunit A [Desulforudis sp.]MDQ7789409.1 F0F1 ATP synthase subunit A [Clostridia bacterium]MDZ4042973.1 F0F1 ATP synthase subunit A [Eubacteriales bacterium]MBU4533183.1 F0F1 ATP synthase subunit A [Bacillota bacterium]
MIPEAGRTPEVPLIERVQQDLNIWNIPEGPWRLGELLGYPIDLNPRTIIFTWVAMVIVLALSAAAVRTAHVRYPGRPAIAYEIIIDFIRDMIKDTMEERKGNMVLSLAMTFLIFIAVMNMLGIVPTLFAPTADHQTAFAFAGVTFVTLHLWGIRYRRGEYLKDFLRPYPFFLPIRLIEEVAKPVTLAIRLFGNMKGKEIMILALLGLITGVAELAGGFMASVLWLGFGLFISIIQAFVFTILSIAYISLAVTESH